MRERRKEVVAKWSSIPRGERERERELWATWIDECGHSARSCADAVFHQFRATFYKRFYIILSTCSIPKKSLHTLFGGERLRRGKVCDGYVLLPPSPERVHLYTRARGAAKGKEREKKWNCTWILERRIHRCVDRTRPGRFILMNFINIYRPRILFHQQSTLLYFR